MSNKKDLRDKIYTSRFTDQFNLRYNHILVGNENNMSYESEILYDIQDQIKNNTNKIDLLNSLTFVLKEANSEIPNAQILKDIEDGSIIKVDKGDLKKAIPSIDYATMQDLEGGLRRNLISSLTHEEVGGGDNITVQYQDDVQDIPDLQDKKVVINVSHNPIFKGNTGAVLPIGSTVQRNNAPLGTLRFNNDTGSLKLEYKNKDNSWVVLDDNFSNLFNKIDLLNSLTFVLKEANSEIPNAQILKDIEDGSIIKVDKGDLKKAIPSIDYATMQDLEGGLRRNLASSLTYEEVVAGDNITIQYQDDVQDIPNVQDKKVVVNVSYNPDFKGNIGVGLPTGNTAQRNNASVGTLRFNNDTGSLKLEYKSKNDRWVVLDGSSSNLPFNLRVGQGLKYEDDLLELGDLIHEIPYLTDPDTYQHPDNLKLVMGLEETLNIYEYIVELRKHQLVNI